MKIGLVIEHFDPRRGGVEQWGVQLAESLIRRGHEVHIVSRSFFPETPTLPIVAHVTAPDADRLEFAQAAEDRLRALDLDVTHDTGYGWHADVFQPHGGSRQALTEQVLLLSSPWIRPFKRVVDPWLWRHRQFRVLSDRQFVNDGRIVLALSRRVAADLTRHHGVDPAHMRLIYNGVDTDRFTPANRAAHREPIRRRLGVSPETTLLLIVAHNYRLKGVPMLMRAVTRWNDSRPVHLLVVGGKRRGGVMRLRKRLGAEAHTTFIGPVDDTAPYYAAADVYVHPTLYDTCSLVVLEALASGMPVVTTRQAGAGELLTDGREGYLLDDPEDVDAFLERLGTLLEPARRDAMGRAARQLAMEHTFERNCDRIVAVYEEVARRKGVPVDDVQPVLRRTA